jgi:hypothetical protein
MGSGGGGSSGKVEYPAYLQTMHSKLLDNEAGDTITFSMVDLLNEAYTTNPFNDASLAIYSGRAVIDSTGTESLPTVAACIAAVLAQVTGFNPMDYYTEKLPLVAAAIDAVILDDAVISSASEAFSDVLEPDVAAEKARYDMDAATVGLAMSSAYVQGKTYIESRRQEKVAFYDADLRAKMYLQRNDMVNITTREILSKRMAMLQLTKETYAFAVEAAKLKILNEREYTEQNIDFLHRKATWRFDALQHGFNAIASIGGGTSVAGTPKLNSTSATVSGAFTGASVGMQIGGGGYGAAAGAVIGGVAGYLGSR